MLRNTTDQTALSLYKRKLDSNQVEDPVPKTSDVNFLSQLNRYIKSKFMASTVSLGELFETQSVPNEIRAILILCGYDNVEAVAAIKDLTVIQDFLKESFKVFTEHEREVMYGRFVDKPSSFVFLPGHRMQLENFVKFCNDMIHEVNLPISYVRRKRLLSQQMLHAVHKKYRIYPSYSSSRKSELRANSFKLSIPTHTESPTSSSTSALETSPSSTTSTMALQFYESHEKIDLYKVTTEVCKQIRKWCWTNNDEKIKSLREGEDYSVQVCYASQLADEAAEEIMDYTVCAYVTCMVCSAKVALTSYQNGFRISNVSRHLSKCAQKKNKPKKLILVRLNESLQSPSDERSNTSITDHSYTDKSISTDRERQEVPSIKASESDGETIA